MFSKIISIILILVSFLFPNDSVYEGQGVQVFPIQETEIQMVSEQINIYRFSEDKWEVNVTGYFKNHGKAKTVQIGFPFEYSSPDFDPACRISDIQDVNKIMDSIKTYFDPQFKAYIDGEEIDVMPKVGIKNPIIPISYNYIYTFNVHFAEHETKKIRHTYQVGGYYEALGSSQFKYILETGSLWKDNIENLFILMEINKDLISTVHCIWPKEYEATEKEKSVVLTWKYKNIKPDFNIIATRLDWKVYQLNLDEIIEAYKDEQIPGISRFLINLICATYGYPFTNPFLKYQFYFHSDKGILNSWSNKFVENPNFKIENIPEKYRTIIDELK